MFVALFIFLFVTLMLGSLYLQGRIASRLKSEMQCIAFKDQDAFIEIQSELHKAGIKYSHLLWSPVQEAYNTLGTAKRTPREIYISRQDVDKVKSVIQLKYNFEVSEFAIIVSAK